MFEFIKLLTNAILPPFNVIILWLLALATARFLPKFSRLCAISGVIILYIFSLPYTSSKLQDSLVKEDNLTLSDYQNAQAIVILGGGLRDSKELYAKITTSELEFERLRYTAFLYKQTGLPILATGSAANGTSEAKIIANELQLFFNVPTMWRDDFAKTTKENAHFSQQILSPLNIKRIILVTHQWHMQRAKMLFEQQGFEVLPASVGAGKKPEHYALNYNYFIPQAGALHTNMLALKEWLGYWKER